MQMRASVYMYVLSHDLARVFVFLGVDCYSELARRSTPCAFPLTFSVADTARLVLPQPADEASHSVARACRARFEFCSSGVEGASRPVMLRNGGNKSDTFSGALPSALNSSFQQNILNIIRKLRRRALYLGFLLEMSRKQDARRLTAERTGLARFFLACLAPRTVRRVRVCAEQNSMCRVSASSREVWARRDLVGAPDDFPTDCHILGERQIMTITRRPWKSIRSSPRAPRKARSLFFHFQKPFVCKQFAVLTVWRGIASNASMWAPCKGSARDRCADDAQYAIRNTSQI